MVFSKNRLNSLAILLVLFCSLFINEWVALRNSEFPAFINYLLRSFPIIGILILVLSNNIFIYNKNDNSFARWYPYWGGYIFIFLFIRVVLFSSNEKLLYFSLSIFQGVVFGYAGYWLIRDKHEIIWLLNKLAIVGVIAGYLDGIALFMGFSDAILLFPEWPIRLFVLYGYCWYLLRWLQTKKNSLNNTLLLIGCMCGVIFTFSKSIIFSVSFSTLALLLIHFLGANKKGASFIRLLSFVFIISGTIFISNKIFGNSIFEFVSNQYYSHFLRIEPGTELSDLNDENLVAASGARLLMWPIALNIINEYLLFGTGKRAIFELGTDLIHVHNWFLDLLVWGGLLGSLPFFIGFIWWLKFSTRKKNLNYGENILIVALAYTLGITGYNLGGTMLSFFSLFPMVMLIIGTAKRYTEISK